MLVAVFGNGRTLHQFHYKIGLAGVGGPRVIDFGDVGVVHHGQGLPLRLKAGDHVAAGHAGADELQRHFSLDRFGLLRHIDQTHAALGDLFAELVGADLDAGFLGDWRSFCGGVEFKRFL